MVKLSWMLLVVLFVGCAVVPHQPRAIEYSREQQERLIEELLKYSEQEAQKREQEEKAQEQKRKIHELWA